MSIIDARLSDCVAYGFTGGPEYLTEVVGMDNGREVRGSKWLYPRHRYSARYPGLPAETRDELLAVFHAAKGRFRAFRFKDWNDFEAIEQPLQVEVGTQTPVQLVKRYTFGSETQVRKIQAVVASTLVVLDDNADPVPGTVDLFGLFTPDANWATADAAATFEFDVWVRFDSDYNAFVIGRPNGHTATVDLLEVRR